LSAALLLLPGNRIHAKRRPPDPSIQARLRSPSQQAKAKRCGSLLILTDFRRSKQKMAMSMTKKQKVS
ncbi:MAG: hypothetical protein DME65_07215, partial [Verrucomicrobia bacterium]